MHNPFRKRAAQPEEAPVPEPTLAQRAGQLAARAMDAANPLDEHLVGLRTLMTSNSPNRLDAGIVVGDRPPRFMEPEQDAEPVRRSGLFDAIPQIITTDWLKRQGACKGGTREFSELWPDGMPLTREALERCRDFGLNIEWATDRLPIKWARRRESARDAQSRTVAKAERKANQRYAVASRLAEEAYTREVDSIILDFAAASRKAVELP